MSPLRACLCLLATTACQSWSDLRTQSHWDALQAATEESARVEAARELAQDDTTHFAGQLLQTLGAYAGSDAEAYVAVAIAKSRPNGMQWLEQRIYGTPLDEAFADCFSHDVSSPGRLDWASLADALMIGVIDRPEADRWLALMAMAEDGESSTRVREALEKDESVRRRVREALDRVDVPRDIPAAMLIAFGPARDDVEWNWLQARYQMALATSIEGRPIDDNAAYDDLKVAWSSNFPGRSAPLPSRDREIMRVLKPLLAPDDAPDVPPSFEEIASFMTRHQRSGWARMIQIYAEGQALPSDALSFVCRVSAAECSEALSGGFAKDIASASDVAPALDLEGGVSTLYVACSQLSSDESRQLAERGLGAGMPLRVREAAVSCLMSLGDDVTDTWKTLLPEALQTKSWADAESIAAVAAGTIDEASRARVMQAVREGEIRAIDVPWLLVGSDEGAAQVRQGIVAADPTALDGLSPEMVGAFLAPVAEHVRAPRRVIELPDMVIE